MTEMFDTTGDGVADLYQSDTNGNGVFDTYLFDANQNGIPEVVSINLDESGLIDEVRVDANEDQVADVLDAGQSSGAQTGSAYNPDVDGDGQISVLEADLAAAAQAAMDNQTSIGDLANATYGGAPVGTVTAAGSIGYWASIAMTNGTMAVNDYHDRPYDNPAIPTDNPDDPSF